MHIFFSGIGGAGIGPLALVAKQAGYEVSGSDMRPGSSITYLQAHGISDIYIGQSREQIAKAHAHKPIDWLVYSSALERDDPHHPELAFARRENIKATKRDELLNQIIKDKVLKLIAIAGTHGKTTTTAMAVWLFKQLGLPLSYSVGSKLSFGEPGELNPVSHYFVYEADEFDRNFLSFYPEASIISGIDYDHPDIYPTRESYEEAFLEFFDQSSKVIIWHDDAESLGIDSLPKYTVLDKSDPRIEAVGLTGAVNRQNAWLVAHAIADTLGKDVEELLQIAEKFPGLSRRFEEVAPGIYSDYAHTPAKIRGALQLAQEVLQSRPRITHCTSGAASSAGAARNPGVVVIYEGLHNTRQHFIKDDLANLFDEVKQLYIVPSYLAREDPHLKLLAPAYLLNLLSKSSRTHAHAAQPDEHLRKIIEGHVAAGDLVLALSAGGAGSLDEWLRENFS